MLTQIFTIYRQFKKVVHCEQNLTILTLFLIIKSYNIYNTYIQKTSEVIFLFVSIIFILHINILNAAIPYLSNQVLVVTVKFFLKIAAQVVVLQLN